MSTPPSPGNGKRYPRPRAIVSVVLLVVALVLAPVVLIAGFAWPIFVTLHCRSSCGHSWIGSIVIWALGAAVVSGLTVAGIRGIVRTPPSQPSQPPQPPRPDA